MNQPPTRPSATEATDALRAAGADFHHRGWSLGTSSNYSAVLGRDPLDLLVTVSGKHKGRLSADDFVHVGADGKPAAGDNKKSSAETMLHVVLAEAAGAGAVLHTHSVWGTLLSDRYGDAGGWAIEGYEMLKGLDGITTHQSAKYIEVFPNTQDIPTLAQQVRGRLEDDADPLRHGFLIRKHGLYAWGEDIDAARRHIEVLEFLFECEGRRLAWGGESVRL
ncbi:Methylthioribulose-1-phosphate dehydratase [Pirellulimonas nuda]|uniref:Methylthioribulose-1-phosphate dehydratase n=1 Tax=Pirellulimonas nuda TaxID=2528009 RepID=A0A518D841_9BACT|nr:methylthioribulose 1-phosphate dehydratase [Pirellulimonas nuda]QDU87628.1 Methylthioribulose-1-phosphate dehydratase [Pirellulimonas nuda]